jgi:hypothetical protein
MENLMDDKTPSTRFPTGIAHRIPNFQNKSSLTRPSALPKSFFYNFFLKTRGFTHAVKNTEQK